jgi:hypothetical protein
MHTAQRLDDAARCAVQKPLQQLIEQSCRFLKLADAYPNARIHIARFEHRHVEGQIRVGPIARPLARIVCAAAGATHIAAGSELACQRGSDDSRRRRAILQRGGVVIERDQLGQGAPHLTHQVSDCDGTVGSKIACSAARHHAVHHQPVAETAVGGAQRALAHDRALRVHEHE